jgi:CRISPR-associated protein Cmr4
MSILLYVHAHSAIHPGTGESSGAVDLAVARNVVTGHPYLPGSSLKGALRAKSGSADFVTKVFGPDPAGADLDSGAAAFGDANLLFLPVRCERGLFAYVTSSHILGRHLRDVGPGNAAPQGAGIGAAVLEREKVAFDDLEAKSIEAKDLARAVAALPTDLQREVAPRAVCVSDDDFATLLGNGLEVVTRVRINRDTNTVENRQLWTEENLPAETILVSRVDALRERGDVEKSVGDIATNGLTYVGGHVTVGRGRTQIYVAQGAP